MKTKQLLLIIGLGISSFCFGQQKLFDKFAAQEGVTSVHISKAMFEMMPSLIQNIEGVNLNALKKIDGLNVLSTDKKELMREMQKTFKELITSSHEELMRILDNGQNITFHAKKKGENIEELLMLIDTSDQYVVIQIKGRFTLQDIQEIISQNKK